MSIDESQLRDVLSESGIRLTSPAVPRLLTVCYRGEHADGTSVFIKAADSTIPNVVRNFTREVAVLQSIRGRPGCPWLMMFRLQGPIRFHACQLVPGRTIETLAAARWSRILEVCSSLAGWISAFHAWRFVHRDLSPEHIFITESGEINVVDFGMAKSIAESSEGELLQGTDLLSFGMIFWELICGRPLFTYRSERIPEELERELRIINEAGLPTAISQVLTNCLYIISELTPDGHVPYSQYQAAHLDQEMRAVLNAERALG